MWEWNPESNAWEFHQDGYRGIVRPRYDGSWYMALYLGHARVMTEWTGRGVPSEFPFSRVLDVMAEDMRESLSIFSGLGI